MKKIKQTYSHQPVSTRILISVLMNLIIVVAVINITLFVLLDTIKKSQFGATDSFFDQYNQFALGQTAQQTKQLLLAVMDSRLVYINLIRTFVLKHGESNNFTHRPCVILNETTTKSDFLTGCYFTNEQTSVFNQHTFQNLEKIIQGTWMIDFPARRLKRVNIILQNRQNPKDIMVKTIPRDPDFIIGDVADILDEMQTRRNDTVILSKPYKDTRSRSESNVMLVSLRSKTIFFTPDKNFTMLIELEVYERFINSPLTRVILSNEVNIAMLHIDSNLPGGFEYMASMSPLDDSVNYSKLLTEGYKTLHLPNNTVIHSHTELISSEYIAGQYNGNSKHRLNQNYCYVITSPSLSLKMKMTIDSFIQSLFTANVSFLILWTFALLIIIFTLTFFATSQIRECLAFCKASIHQYLDKPANYGDIVKDLYLYSFRWQPFTFVLRTVGRIIKEIQAKKNKGKKSKFEMETYPLNVLETNFAHRYFQLQNHKFIEWFEIIKSRNNSFTKIEEYSFSNKSL